MNKDLLSKTIRADEKFIEKIRGTIPKRIKNFPNENVRSLTDRELTRMIVNTTGFEETIKDLETLPRREK